MKFSWKELMSFSFLVGILFFISWFIAPDLNVLLCPHPFLSYSLGY